MPVCVCVYHVSAGVQGKQRALTHLELELRAGANFQTWVLETQFRSAARAANTLNC